MADETHLAIARQGVPTWNEWRNKDWNIHPDLEGADLQGGLFAGANLRDANLARSNLAGANLAGADLTYANLHEANLAETWLVGADLSDAYVANAEMAEANLDRTDLCYATLRSSNLGGARILNAILGWADLAGANLARASLRGANLHDADLSGVCLHDANLQQTILRGARLDGADLTGANLSATDRTGWSIRGVSCRQAFWDLPGQHATSYGEGEFERRFAEQPQLFLRHSSALELEDLMLLALLLEHLRAHHPACGLHLRSLRDHDGGGTEIAIAVADLAGRNAAALNAEFAAMGDTLLAFQGQLAQDRELRLTVGARYRSLVRELLPRFARRLH